MKRRQLLIILIGALFLALFINPKFSMGDVNAFQEESPTVILASSEGPITPVLVEYLKRSLSTAEETGASLLVLQLDTPGGSIDIMNDIVQVIRTSDIPIIVYVAPQNAIAGSAGTVITLAGHLAAMAPETSIGAASPVGAQGEDIEKTLETKTKEVLKATIRSLTANRPIEAVHLAEDTIDFAKAVTVDEALEIGLIDIKAVDLSDLLDQLDGKTVNVKNQIITLNTSNARVIEVEKTIIEDILLLLINPNLVFILLSIGIQALLIELSSPGGWAAGFFGAVCLLLAMYGLGLLPVNWFGLLLLILAFILFVLEIKAATHGALTAAGIVSFVTGTLVLFNSNVMPGIPGVSVPLVIGTSIVIAAVFLTILTLALRARNTKISTGKESLIGKTGYVEVDLNPEGMVRVNGELWRAQLDDKHTTAEKGNKIEILEVKGLLLIVKDIQLS